MRSISQSLSLSGGGGAVGGLAHPGYGEKMRRNNSSSSSSSSSSSIRRIVGRHRGSMRDVGSRTRFSPIEETPSLGLFGGAEGWREGRE